MEAMTTEEKLKLREWEAYLEDIRNSTPMENGLDEAAKKRKLAWLETHPLEWITYFFPGYARYPFAEFHKRAIRRILSNDEWYEVLSWSRELAKSTVVMFCAMFLALTGRKRNFILASATETSAEKLLAPYKANFEANGRLKQFYGETAVPGSWTSTAFRLRNGAAFYAIGAGNAPRGTRNESVRPDAIIVDDFDTDEDCRNIATLDKKWDWFEKALYPTRSVSEPTLVIFCGNIIAKDTCVARAGKMADHWDIVNIVDRNGNSTWPEKNTPEKIDRIRMSISKKAFQGEYMNNPVSEGKIFKNLPYGKVPALKKFKFLVVYGDPAYSNRKDKSDSMKAAWLVGKVAGKYYVIKGFLARETNANYIGWFYELRDFVEGKTAVYLYQENNSLQDPFFEQVFKPLIRQANMKRHDSLFINPDNRAKIDKAARIEAKLEPLDRNGALVFNEEEKDNPHMTELHDQFGLFEMSLPYNADGPDCIEGAVKIIDDKMLEASSAIDTIPFSSFKDKSKRM